MAKKYTKICKHCGTEIAKSAKICPACGGKNPKPLYKRVWFWLLLVVVLITALLGCDTSEPAPAPEDREYVEVTVDEMFDELDTNALNAEEKYKDMYVSVKGNLSVIDSDGDYIAIKPLNKEYTLDSVHCRITNDEQLETVKGLSVGDTIVVKGKITDIGEVTGFYLNIDSIEK